MSLLEGWPVREIVEHFPEVRAVLDRHGVDLCCGGAHPLAQTARAKGVDPEAVCAEVDAAVRGFLESQTVAAILQRWPQTRAVFDRYGLHGCGGAQGPAESLEYFARIHGVSTDALIRALIEGIRAPAGPAASCPIARAPRFLPFFRAAIAVAGALGTLVAIYLTVQYALRGDILSLPLLPWIHAHAFAWIYGFAFLFVAGFALEALPRFRLRPPADPRTAEAILAPMLVAVLLRVALAASTPWAAAIPATMAAIAAAVFLRFVVRTLRPVREPYEAYLIAGTLCFVASAVAEAVFPIALAAAGDDVARIGTVASWIPPIRDLQFLGFVTLWVFGVGQRIWPAAFGCRTVSRRSSWAAGGVLLASALGAAAAWPLYRQGMLPRAFYEASVTAHVGATVWMVFASGILRPGAAAGRSGKFLRASAVWLFVACGMLAASPLYMAARGSFSHAWFGAQRHAFAVGFLVLMIAGVSARIVPVWTGRAPRASLAAAFGLLNAGTALRVAAEVAADWTAYAAWALPISAALLALGLLAWGWEVWPRPALQPAAAPAAV